MGIWVVLFLILLSWLALLLKNEYWKEVALSIVNAQRARKID